MDLPNHGSIIFPLSISRLRNSQSPLKIIEYLSMLDRFVNKPTNDVVFLYTDGLYQNTNEESFKMRKRILNEVLAHSKRLKKLLKQNSNYVQKCFQFLSFNSFMLSDSFAYVYNKISYLSKNNVDFRVLIKNQLNGRDFSDINIHFVVEELTVSFMIRNYLFDIPTYLSKDNYRLIAYPKPYIKTESFISSELSDLSGQSNIFKESIFDFNSGDLKFFN